MKPVESVMFGGKCVVMKPHSIGWTEIAIREASQAGAFGELVKVEEDNAALRRALTNVRFAICDSTPERCGMSSELKRWFIDTIDSALCPIRVSIAGRDEHILEKHAENTNTP